MKEHELIECQTSKEGHPTLIAPTLTSRPAQQSQPTASAHRLGSSMHWKGEYRRELSGSTPWEGAREETANVTDGFHHEIGIESHTYTGATTLQGFF
jgi:hypothetical protein